MSITIHNIAPTIPSNKAAKNAHRVKTSLTLRDFKIEIYWLIAITQD
jgi:hypothetical protein